MSTAAPSRWRWSATGRSSGTSCATTPISGTPTSSSASATAPRHVKDFFLHYDETRSNDFVLENGAAEVELLSTDIADWRDHLRRHRPQLARSASGCAGCARFVDGRGMFLANYADVLTDAPLPDMIERFDASDAVASLLAVPPQSSHHVVDIGDDGLITQVTPMRDLRQWENGGYFVLRPEIFDHLNEGEDLVEDALVRLVPAGRVLAYPYNGYWSPADTVKERAQPRGDVPPRELPVDDLGPGAVGRWRRCQPDGTAGRDGPGVVRRRSAWPAVMLTLTSRRRPRRTRRCPFSRSARTPTTSRSAPAGCCSPWPKASRAWVRYVVLTGTAERHAEARERGTAVPARR